MYALPPAAAQPVRRLAADPLEPPVGFRYFSNRVLGPGRLRFGPAEPSAEARSEHLARELWSLGAGQLGLTPDTGLVAG